MKIWRKDMQIVVIFMGNVAILFVLSVKKKICSECAIFGYHKTHDIKKSDDVM